MPKVDVHRGHDIWFYPSGMFIAIDPETDKAIPSTARVGRVSVRHAIDQIIKEKKKDAEA